MSGDQGVRGSWVQGSGGDGVRRSRSQGFLHNAPGHQATRPPKGHSNDPSTHANMMGFTSSARKNNMRIVLLEAMQGCRATLGGAHQETLESIISIDS